MNVIVLSGKRGSGKTTTAEHMQLLPVSKSEDIPVIGSIATAIKETAAAALGIKYTPALKADMVPMLQGMADTHQSLAANPKVDYSATRWIGLLFDTHRWERHTRYLIIDDVRFEYELEYLQAQAGAGYCNLFTARLVCPEEIRAERTAARDGKQPSLDTLRHQSETALDDYQGWDLIVPSNEYTPAWIAETVMDWAKATWMRDGHRWML